MSPSRARPPITSSPSRFTFTAPCCSPIFRRLTRRVGRSTPAFIISITAVPPLIPVVGVTEAACATARSRGKITIMARRLSDSFRSLIPIQNAWERGWTDLATGYGLKPGEFSLRRVFVPGHPDPETLVDLTNRDQAKLRDLTVAGMSEALHAEGLEQTRAAIKEDGARAVYFACAFWSLPISELEKAGNAFGVPVINPLVSAVSYAEHLLLSGRPVQAAALV